MQLIDTHCHLDDERFDTDRSNVIRRAAGAGIQAFIVPAIHAESCRTIHDLQQRYDLIHPAYGLHPWFCDKHREEDFALLAELLGACVAVGECGLDFGLCNTDAETQLRWLRPQLQLAVDFNLPVILHAYKATDMIIGEIKKQPGLRGVVHSFSGSRQQAQQLIDRGFCLGFGGAITHPHANRLHELVRQLPLSHMLLETDAPDQTPYGQRGKRNEPVFIIEIIRQLAKLRDMDTNEITDICNANAKELFNL
ncbi:TatD DNase family protein [Mariprofundus micogutta]|uniref:TatD DNase family protein n=1 Tax=Mariprofundus micogutta TaxID=1921010 RepID=A0A1L8CQ08_9PROT|nr:TatD family hydrolase [Mariprofundus micogutta]GAV21001.1 TatD DNase family protein [Mariprofundus micogutta]